MPKGQLANLAPRFKVGRTASWARAIAIARSSACLRPRPRRLRCSAKCCAMRESEPTPLRVETVEAVPVTPYPTGCRQQILGRACVSSIAINIVHHGRPAEPLAVPTPDRNRPTSPSRSSILVRGKGKYDHFAFGTRREFDPDSCALDYVTLNPLRNCYVMIPANGDIFGIDLGIHFDRARDRRYPLDVAIHYSSGSPRPGPSDTYFT
jgi:hypothetical protein